jgi:4-amino-4-deoxy-L-arabinose transferase-like glycosyltransferase
MNNLIDAFGQTTSRQGDTSLRQDECRDSTTIVPSAPRPALHFAQRLLDQLNDPIRHERTAVLLLIGYAAVWTLYAVIAKSSQDIHFDMSEQFVLGQELAFGYDKHPPLTMLIVRLWFAVFPAADWAYYLLAMVNSAFALWVIWKLTARFLDGDKRVVGLALLTFVPFFNFHALKFNPNTVLMPLWAMTTFAFLRSFETRRPLDAALAGFCAAAAMYGKYWSVFLLLGLAVAALSDTRRADYFRSPAPWISMMVGAVAIAPHVIWLFANHFAPFSYAVLVHGDVSSESSLQSVLSYLLGSIAYVSVPLVIVISLTRPDRQVLNDVAWPTAPSRRLAATAFWSTLLLPALIAPAIGVRLTSLWSMSAWTLLPVMLLSSPLITVVRKDAARILAAAIALPLVMLAIAPAFGFVIHRVGKASDGHSSLLAGPVKQLWRETTDQPLKVFGSTGVFTYGIPFYLPDHPIAVHVLERPATVQEEKLIQKNGVAMVCPTIEAVCMSLAKMRAAQSPFAKETQVEVRRSYLGGQGSPARYLIIAIPPKES